MIIFIHTFNCVKGLMSVINLHYSNFQLMLISILYRTPVSSDSADSLANEFSGFGYRNECNAYLFLWLMFW